MTTRRINTTDKTALDVDATSPSIPASKASSSSTAPAVPGSVITKLLLFTFAMIAGPLTTYYIFVSMLFKGNNTVAGAAAAVAANAVLIGYVIVAMREDAEDRENEKKAQ